MSPSALSASPQTVDGPRRSAAVEAVVAAIGAALLLTAVTAHQAWLDRHFLPSFFLMRAWYVRIESFVRLLIGAIGVWLLVWGRRHLARLAAQNPGGIVAVLVAAGLALGASDLALTWLRPSTEWLVGREEPLRQPDARLGWTFVPARVGHKTVGGRQIEYAFDAAGDRVRDLNHPVDPSRPTILFTGESIMAGEGLTWEESVPAQVGSRLGVQSANLAVHGYATDQAYLRLTAALPRFAQPVAVISLFMTALLGRNLDDDRPHLGPGLLWVGPVKHGSLASLAKLLVPYRREVTVERGIALTIDTLRATAALATARGAAALIVVPQLGAEDEVERTLRRQILDDTGLPYVFVEFERDWRLPGDLHPNARAAQTIAEAVAARLRELLTKRP